MPLACYADPEFSDGDKHRDSKTQKYRVALGGAAGNVYTYMNVAKYTGKLGVCLASAEQGLSDLEVRNRRKKHGKNALKKREGKSARQIFVNQFKSLIIFLLSAATLASFIMGEWVDGIAISVAIVVNTMIGFVTELKAVRSMEALEEIGRAESKVRRGGNVREVRSEDLVAGDIVVFESGDLVR